MKTQVLNGTFRLRLGETTRRYAELAAREAANVFNLIKSRTTGMYPTLVIANQRYGSLFVVDPIAEYLAALGVTTVRERIPSNEVFFLNNEVAFRISEVTWEWISRNNPNIFVVDGTSMPVSRGLARFPGAMEGYINAFRTYNHACGTGYPGEICFPDLMRLAIHRPSNGYRINFWAPNMTSSFLVGDYRYDLPKLDFSFNNFSDKLTRDLTIVCSTSSGNEFSKGFFDDPEKHLRYLKRGMFGGGWIKAFKDKTTEPTERIFIGEIQRVMRERIPEYIKN